MDVLNLNITKAFFDTMDSTIETWKEDMRNATVKDMEAVLTPAHVRLCVRVPFFLVSRCLMCAFMFAGQEDCREAQGFLSAVPVQHDGAAHSLVVPNGTKQSTLTAVLSNTDLNRSL
jgi:hypothetical protein